MNMPLTCGASLRAFLLIAISVLAAPFADAAAPKHAAAKRPATPGPSGENRVTVTVTAYNATVKQTDSTPYHGAFGARLDSLPQGQRAIALSPDLIALGLKEGQHVKLDHLPGDFVVMDKTPGRWSRRVDVFMGTDTRGAKHFGRKHMQLVWQGPHVDIPPAPPARKRSKAGTPPKTKKKGAAPAAPPAVVPAAPSP